MKHGLITLRYDKCLLISRDFRDCFPYYEIFLAREYPLSIRRGDVVLDLGAHIGFFTVYAARRAGKVIAVEPLPRNFHNLEVNVRLNKLDNVILVNKAIAQRTGYSHLTQDSLSSHLSERGVPCRTTTIDELLEELGLTPDVVKVDIEGAEVYCTGSRRLVEAREICVETHGTQDLIENWLKSHNYSCSSYFYSPMRIAKEVVSNLRTNLSAYKLFLRCLLSFILNPEFPHNHLGNIQIVYGRKHIN
jgi:FkbM family methyltransferase